MVFSQACTRLITTSNSLLKISCINGCTGQLLLIWQTTTYNFTAASYLWNNIKSLEQPKRLENLGTKGANLRMWDTQTVRGFFFRDVSGEAHRQPSRHTPTTATSPCSSTPCFPDGWQKHHAPLGWQPPASQGFPSICQRFNWEWLPATKISALDSSWWTNL